MRSIIGRCSIVEIHSIIIVIVAMMMVGWTINVLQYNFHVLGKATIVWTRRRRRRGRGVGGEYPIGFVNDTVGYFV